MTFLFRRPALTVLFFCALAGAGLIAEDDSASIQEAQNASQSWLTEIDSGHYEQSYAEGCLAFHNKVTREEWTTVLKAMRGPFGTVTSRKIVSSVYKPQGYGGLQGECMVITYNTVFSKMSSVAEAIVLQREDGRWRGAGYNAQPQGDAQSDSPPAATPETEVNQQPAH